MAGLTREIHFHQATRIWVQPANLLRYTPLLSRFTNVTTLNFGNLFTAAFTATSASKCFKPFIAGVQNLRLYHPITRPTSLMKFILLFSAAVHIQISGPRWSAADEIDEIDSNSTPQEESGFTGVLHLHGFGEKWPEFFVLLSARRLRFQKLRLQRCEFNTSVPTQSLLQAVSRSACTLHLEGGGRRGLDFTLSREPG